MSTRLRILLGMTSALLAAAALAAGCGSSSNKSGGGGSAGRTETLRFHSGAGPGNFWPIETKLKAVDGNNAGFTRTDSLADASGARAGFEDTLCVAGALRGRTNCQVTLSLKRGTIVADGVLSGSYGGSLPVTGGTGSYEGARGTYETTSPGPEPLLIRVHLLLP